MTADTTETAPVVTEKRRPKFLAMDAHHYGFGNTVDEAKKRMKEFGGSLRSYVVFALPEGSYDPYVDQMGRVGWKWDDGYDGPLTVELDVAAKRGV